MIKVLTSKGLVTDQTFKSICSSSLSTSLPSIQNAPDIPVSNMTSLIHIDKNIVISTIRYLFPFVVTATLTQLAYSISIKKK